MAYHNFAYFKWFLYQKNNRSLSFPLRSHVPVYPEIVESIMVFPWFGMASTIWGQLNARMETFSECRVSQTV